MEKASRRTERCPECGLVQFWPEGKAQCVRCKLIITRTLTAKLEMKPDRELVEGRSFAPKPFGERMRSIRRCRRLSQRQLAAELGVKRTYISKIENGKFAPKIRRLKQFGAALDVDVCGILDERMSAEDLTTGNQEEIAERERFLGEIAELLPGIEPHDRRILLQAAKAMEAGQYTLPEWMKA